ncbi:hypothetical protein LDENG_00079970 [Lucifuga dentata]|nr:hypothetical protein LDENG_00079970 [Lucifuga dentata]
MVHEELGVRLNDRSYKHWLKAGRCLLILKEGLHPYINSQMRTFHADLLNQNTLLRRPCEGSCRPTGNKLLWPCKVCSEWQRVILIHHRHPNATVNWDNCSPPFWRIDHWELAKAFMPRGQLKVSGAAQCDASALLNLINYCDCFCIVDLKFVRELIRCRNELMHSCELRVNDAWMKHFQVTLEILVKQFNHIPQMATVAQQINEMLTVNWSICVSGFDRMDGAHLERERQWEANAALISQWEAELLQETLQELLNSHDDTEEPIADIICEICAVWKEKILANHTNPGGRVHWRNSNPPLWPTEKWEVAKVFMPDGQKSKNKLRDFDIPALLIFMIHCKHFEEYSLKACCEEIVNVRNEIMHSTYYELEKEELQEYLGRIKVLSEELGEKVPEFKELSKDIEGIQQSDIKLVLPSFMEPLHGEDIQINEYSANLRQLNAMRKKLTEEDMEYLLFAFVQEASNDSCSQESLRRNETLLRERLAKLEKERDDLYEEEADHTEGSFMVCMSMLEEKIDDIKNKLENLHSGISQASRFGAMADLDRKSLDTIKKLYVWRNTPKSEEEEEEEEPKMLPKIFSMVVQSAISIAKRIVGDDDDD